MSIFHDRQFFVHAAHTAVGISSGVSAWHPAEQPLAPIVPLQPDPRRRICLLSGCACYESDQSLSLLAGFLEQHYEVVCSKAFARSRCDLPGLDQLAKSDCLVVFAQRLAIAGEQLAQLRAYFASGGPVVALVGPTGAIESWPGWEAEILGVEPSGRLPGSMGAPVEPAPFSDGHPILEGVSNLNHGGSIPVYREVGPSPTALLAASVGGVRQPVAWVRNGGGGRAFFTTLGHPQDFRKPAMLQLLANAVLWAGRDRRR